MKYSQHDLSFDNVKLDYAALVNVAFTAVCYSRDAVERHLPRIQHLCFKQDFSKAGYEAVHLADASLALAKSLETFAVLNEGYRREFVEIVNKGPVVEDEPADKQEEELNN